MRQKSQFYLYITRLSMLAYTYTFGFENINLSSILYYYIKIKTTDIIHPAFNWVDLKAKNLQKKETTTSLLLL